MKKAVILTEGQTEQLFVEELLLHAAAQANFHVECKKLNGGKKFPTIEMQVSASQIGGNDPDFYALILDCASDGKVVSSLAERYKGFVQQSYDEIILIRDVAPDADISNKSRLISGINKTVDRIVTSLPGQSQAPIVVLATMEVEAWFLAEFTHFNRLNQRLDPATLQSLGLDINSNFEDIEQPAKLLKEIYESVGASYGKSKADVKDVISLLDLSAYRNAVPPRVPSISPLMSAIQRFFVPPVSQAAQPASPTNSSDSPASP